MQNPQGTLSHLLCLTEPRFACLSKNPDGIQGETDQQGAQNLQQKQTQNGLEEAGEGGFLVVQDIRNVQNLKQSQNFGT